MPLLSSTTNMERERVIVFSDKRVGKVTGKPDENRACGCFFLSRMHGAVGQCPEVGHFLSNSWTGGIVWFFRIFFVHSCLRFWHVL